ncbi:hypothetical protein CLAIMM_14745 [Cladophialophora immunda]|nr:hypothetical protein CLAIMM_14745 [Cladophialophora immunda]
MCLPMAAGLVVGGFICREISAFNGSDQVSAVEGLFYTATYVFTVPLYALILHLDYHLPTYPPALVPRIHPPLYLLLISIFTSAIIACTAQGCATYFSPESLFLNLLLIIILKVWLIRLCIRRRRPAQQTSSPPHDVAKVVGLVFFLLGLIVLTNVFRTVQIYAQPTSRLWTTEGWFWGFMVAEWVLYSAAWHLMHPGRMMNQRGWGQCCHRSNRGGSGNEQTPARKV